MYYLTVYSKKMQNCLWICNLFMVKNFTFRPQSQFIFHMILKIKDGFFPLNSNNQVVFTVEMYHVSCEVGTEVFNII